jgi:hypothetical protein
MIYLLKTLNMNDQKIRLYRLNKKILKKELYERNISYLK